MAAAIIAEIAKGAEKQELADYFNDLISVNALEAAAERHVKYARRLLASNVSMFEEVYKLFSLFEELEALKALGLKPPEKAEADMQTEFSKWYCNSQNYIRETAKMFHRPWTASYWFFRVMGVE